MNSQAQGTYTRILPWAALALMVVFFFWQVAKRNEVVAALETSEERVRELEAGRALAPGAAASTPPSASAELARLGSDLAAAEARADAAEASAAALAAKLEQAEAVRAAEAARAKALAADRDTAQGTEAALRMQLEQARQAATARLAALRSERDAAQGALAAVRMQMEELQAQATAAGEEAWLREQERDYARSQMAKLAKEAEASAAEATALRRALADVQTQMERMLRQARENQAHIEALKARPAAASAALSPRAHVDRSIALATAGPDRTDAQDRLVSAHATALREAWMAETPEARAAKVDAYVAVLDLLPPGEETTATARRLTTIGMLPDDVLARAVGRLASTHLTDAYSWMTFLLRGGPELRAVILQRLRVRAPQWSEEERASFGRALVAQLRSDDAARRRDVAWGIGALGHRGGQTQLVRLLEDDDAKVRHAAAWTLTRMPRSAATVEPLKRLAKTLLDSPKPADMGEGIWLAQWVLGQPQNIQWVDLTDAQLRRVAGRLRPRLDG